MSGTVQFGRRKLTAPHIMLKFATDGVNAEVPG